jgi:hypothetical protein
MSARDRASLVCVYVMVLGAYLVPPSGKQVGTEIEPVFHFKNIFISDAPIYPYNVRIVHDFVPIGLLKFRGQGNISKSSPLSDCYETLSTVRK